MKQMEHNPDVLNCLANLSNDEVFTPPALVNQMLDLLPQELFKDPDSTFLDPFCKTGVFLREIVKRLDKGLEDIIPDRQERIDHILHKQVFGMAITELTSLLTRRTLYCSKFANGEHSISHFDTPEGNVWYKPLKHTWENGKCKYCGAPQSIYDRSNEEEQYAYPFIHLTNSKSIYNMRFSVICGNPPYQLSDGGAQASSIPIYNKFVDATFKLNPQYVCIIMPSRWMTGGRGLDDFRNTILQDGHLSKLYDYVNADSCFTGVEIKGGVCFFLRDASFVGKCENHYFDVNNEEHVSLRDISINDGILIRDSRALGIKEKIQLLKEESFMSIVSSMKPYGLRGDFFSNPSKYDLPNIVDHRCSASDISILGLGEGQKRVIRYAPFDYPLPNKSGLKDYKLFVPRNFGEGKMGDTPYNAVIGAPNEACTETFIQVYPFNSITEVENCYSYMKTRLFRLLLCLSKNDQGASKSVYRFCPLQDWSKPWTDAELYKKYSLSQEEIEYIESMINPME